MRAEDLKICYGLVDSVAGIGHDGMRKLVMDLNYAFDSIMMPLVEEDAMSMLAFVADNTDYTHLVLFDSGTVLVNSDRLRKSLYHLCEKEWLVAGHILFREDDQYPYLHHQTYAVNVGLWRDMGRPEFGNKDRGPRTLPAVWRSQENIHDDYTPIWLKRHEGVSTNVSRVKFGWNMIATSLERGYMVHNIPMDARISKIYLYPDDDPEQLSGMVDSIRRGEDPDISVIGNDSQRRFLANQKWTMADTSQSIVFIYNTGDTAVNIPKPTQATALWNTASGFKPFQEWFYRDMIDHAQMNTFDYNPRALELWRYINSGWDGHDLYSFIRAQNEDCDNEDLYCWGNKLDYETPREASDRQEMMLHDFCGGRDRFVEAWALYRRLDHRYHSINLLEQPEMMAGLMDQDRNHYVWINNIFYFNRTIRRYGIENVHARLFDFVRAIRDSGVNNLICGQSASMHFFDPASTLYDQMLATPDLRYQCQLEFQNHGIRRWAGHPLPY